MKDKKMLFGIILAFVFLLSIGLTYAYFYVTVSGNEDAKAIKTSTGTLEILYNGGPEINVKDIYPGWTTTKTFTVENTGSLDVVYSISFEEIINEILYDEMKMSMTCTGNGCRTLSIINTPTTTGPFTEGITISPGVTHTYQLTFTFIETNSIQNYNQNKKFGGKIIIEESISLFTLNGILRNSLGNPVPNATITLRSEPRTTLTNENGEFTFDNVSTGNHTISAIDSSSNSILSETTISINNGTTKGIDGTTVTKVMNMDKLEVVVYLGSSNDLDRITFINPTLSSYLLNNYQTVGLTQINQSATELQDYDTVEYRYQGGRECAGVSMNNEVCEELGSSCYYDDNDRCFACKEFDGKTWKLNKTHCENLGGHYYDDIPDNYINFNNQIWRIIGVFETKENLLDSTPEYRVKIVKEYEESFDNYSWNSYYDELSDWYYWSNSSLKDMINSGAYYNRGIGKTFEECSIEDSIYEGNLCDFSSVGLSNASKAMISNAVWYLGTIDLANNNLLSKIYSSERSKSFYSADNYQSTWVGKVGLIYPSDVGYSSLNCVQEDKYSKDSIEASSWMPGLINGWTINKEEVDSPITVEYDGSLSFIDEYLANKPFLPTVYLKASVEMTGGTGTEDNPYTIE